MPMMSIAARAGVAHQQPAPTFVVQLPFRSARMKSPSAGSSTRAGRLGLLVVLSWHADQAAGNRDICRDNDVESVAVFVWPDSATSIQRALRSLPSGAFLMMKARWVGLGMVFFFLFPP